MKLRERLRMFALTRQEQRTIAFIVLAIVLGLATKHYRHTHARPPAAPNELTDAAASVSPSPPPAR